MKIGYSMLLGEFINAERIIYPDCRNFQIVCPSCREPIFKAVRGGEALDVIHYLSHYQKERSYVSECELRVEQITKGEVKSHNNMSRGQKLEYFLSVLRDAILKSEYITKRASHTKGLISRMMSRSPGVQLLCDMQYRLVKSEPAFRSDEQVFKLFDEYIDDIMKVTGGQGFETEFSIETQQRIGLDIWLHLLSEKGKANFKFLFCHGYLVLMARIRNAAEFRSLLEFEKPMILGMAELIEGGRNRVQAIFEMLANTKVGPPFAIEGSNLLNKMASEIVHEMLGTLIRLPYFEMLKEMPRAGLDMPDHAWRGIRKE